jgi:hypothetical protein
MYSKIKFRERRCKKLKKKNIFNIILDIMCQVCFFVFIQYILACFYLSFKNHILNIIFVIGNAGVIIHFSGYLSRIIENKIVKILIILVGIIIVGLVLLLHGYFPVSTTPMEVLL